MHVYEFNKCLLDRFEESMNVLFFENEYVPACRVRREWSCYIELQIEPAGWQALWRIPRVICEEMNVRFPTVVYGVVEQVLFEEMKALFLVLAVQDDDVQLPEIQKVNLEDLWPTKEQENAALNIERTADCIDRFRFFYTNVWMPWDEEEDDVNWVERNLESRIRLCYDLQSESMKRSTTLHIKTLLTEARYIQQRKEYLEEGLIDKEDLEDVADVELVAERMRLGYRMNVIKSEIEVLENPKMREVLENTKYYDEMYFKEAEGGEKPVAYIVTNMFSLAKQMEFMRLATTYINKETPVQMSRSLQDVLRICNPSDDIYLPPGKHAIKFLEKLNNNGKIIGLVAAPSNASIEKPDENMAVIVSVDEDGILLTFDGNFTLRNVTLDCRNVRCGVLVKSGKVVFDGCRIIGDGKSSTQQGIVCSRNSVVHMQHCILEEFTSGIIANYDSSVTLSNCKISKCRIGIDVIEGSKITFEQCSILNSTKCGIYMEMNCLNNKAEGKVLTLNDLTDLSEYIFDPAPCYGECKFMECKTNIYVVNDQKLQFPKSMNLMPLWDEKPDWEKEDNNSDMVIINDSDTTLCNDSN